MKNTQPKAEIVRLKEIKITTKKKAKKGRNSYQKEIKVNCNIFVVVHNLCPCLGYLLRIFPMDISISLFMYFVVVVIIIAIVLRLLNLKAA